MLSVLHLDIVILRTTCVAGATWEEESTRRTGSAAEEPLQTPTPDPVLITPQTPHKVIKRVYVTHSDRNFMPLFALYITTAFSESTSGYAMKRLPAALLINHQNSVLVEVMYCTLLRSQEKINQDFRGTTMSRCLCG